MAAVVALWRRTGNVNSVKCKEVEGDVSLAFA